MTPLLPQFLQDLLAHPPRTGVHQWLYSAARQLHVHLPAVEIIELLESRVKDCRRTVPRHEIVSAVTNSISCAWEPGRRTEGAPPPAPGPKWPPVNRERREAIISENGHGLADLWELSHVRIEDNKAHTESIIDRLFPGNPLLCCGKSNSVFATKPRKEWRGELSELQLIVPSPMTAPLGRKKNPKPGKSEWSAHTLDNTGPRRFLVCEFDQGTADEQAALLIHLGGFAPMVCALSSGGKSLHGWFLVESQPDDMMSRFFRYAVSLGADDATWSRCQFCRMPDGTRDNGARQTVYFLNCKPLEAAQ